MQKKINKSKVIVYVVIGVLAAAAIIAATIYLPDVFRSLHGG